MNHQRSSEYVLALSSGQVYASLHQSFSTTLYNICQRWASLHQVHLNFTFTPSCHTSRVELTLKNASHLYESGIPYYTAPDYITGLKYSTYAHHLNPQNDAYLTTRADMLVGLNDIKPALRYLYIVHARSPTYTPALILLARAEQARHLYEDAIAHCRLALQLLESARSPTTSVEATRIVSLLREVEVAKDFADRPQGLSGNMQNSQPTPPMTPPPSASLLGGRASPSMSARSMQRTPTGMVASSSRAGSPTIKESSGLRSPTYPPSVSSRWAGDTAVGGFPSHGGLSTLPPTLGGLTLGGRISSMSDLRAAGNQITGDSPPLGGSSTSGGWTTGSQSEVGSPSGSKASGQGSIEGAPARKESYWGSSLMAVPVDLRTRFSRGSQGGRGSFRPSLRQSHSAVELSPRGSYAGAAQGVHRGIIHVAELQGSPIATAEGRGSPLATTATSTSRLESD
jgi:hypothetical protein